MGVMDMMDALLNMVEISQLEVLGFTVEHGYFLIMFFSFLLLYLLVKPFITVLADKRYVYVLVYVIGSLIMLVISLVLSILQADFLYLKIGIQSISLCGF